MTYRQADGEDALILCELGQLLNAIHHAARPDIYTAATAVIARDLSHWAGFLGKPDQIAFIASVGSRPAGFITASLMKTSGPLMQAMDFVRIGSVCVEEQHWGKGLGRGLLAQVKDWAIAHDAQDLKLAVWEFNTRAIGLYTELGFETRALEMGMRL